LTDKTEEADAVNARSAAAQEADDEQQRANAYEKRRRPVQRLTRRRRRRLSVVSRTGGDRQKRTVPQPVSMGMLPYADADQ